MDLGPHAESVLVLVDLVESGAILHNPRPQLAPGIVHLTDEAEIYEYRMIWSDVPDRGKRSVQIFPGDKVFEWRELLDAAGELDRRWEVNDEHDDFLDSVPDLLDNLWLLMEKRVAPALDRHLGGKFEENTLNFIYGNLDFIVSYRASFGRSKPFIERLVEIYRLGGHPCGWVGPYPHGRLVAYFPPMDDTLTPEATTPIRLRFDANGRAIPLTEAEHDAHREAIRAALKRMAEVPDDDPPVPDEEIFRAIDEGRPHRPLFEGLY